MLTTTRQIDDYGLFARLKARLSRLSLGDMIYAAQGYNPNYRELTPEEKLKALSKHLDKDSQQAKEKEKDKSRER